MGSGWGTGSCTDRRKVPGCVFWDFWAAGFGGLVPCQLGLPALLATIGAGPLMALRCLGLFLACFGFLLAFAPWVFGAAAPILALLAPLAILPGPGLAWAFVFCCLRLFRLFALLFRAVWAAVALWWGFLSLRQHWGVFCLLFLWRCLLGFGWWWRQW